MNKTIIINWKWLSVNAIDASNGLPSQITSDWVGEKQVSGIPAARLIQLNLQREEAEFDDEEELYDPANALLKNWLDNIIVNNEVLLLLHKNAPHFYCNYDIDYLQSHYPNLKIVLFGGGEDFVYDLHNPSSGFLDQVGGFVKSAVVNDQEVSASHFNGIWEYYIKPQTSFNEVFILASNLLDELMPHGDVSLKAKQLSKQIIEQNSEWLTSELKGKLFELDNSSKIDLLGIRACFEKIILETTI